MGARRCTDGRHQSRLKLDAKTVGQSNARRRRVHDSGLGGKVSSRVRGNSAGDTIVVSLYRLIHPFGEGQVGESVVGVEQRVGRAVQRGSTPPSSPQEGQQLPTGKEYQADYC